MVEYTAFIYLARRLIMDHKGIVKPAVVWFFSVVGAGLAAVGVVSVEGWQAAVTPGVVDGVAGIAGLVVGGVVAKVTGWVMDMFNKKEVV